jgi:acetyl-CoA carboxylase biotin carboxylase subunit
MFKKILIANRGEIAVRIIRACKEWGISTVAIHSNVDRESMHVKLADESICVGSHQPANSYLNIPAILSAIELTNSEAVHPGYGFLSENFNFAKILEDNKIKFIGPSSNLIKKMGDKIQAKIIAKENGLPIIEGSEGGIKDKNDAKELCKKIGYPILIKASGGGGGKGMKIVKNENEFDNLFATAKSEAQKYFGNDEVYIEKFFQNPRHIEVQILSGKNRTVHLHERDRMDKGDLEVTFRDLKELSIAKSNAFRESMTARGEASNITEDRQTVTQEDYEATVKAAQARLKAIKKADIIEL